jgi:hypothetical protein
MIRIAPSLGISTPRHRALGAALGIRRGITGTNDRVLRLALRRWHESALPEEE